MTNLNPEVESEIEIFEIEFAPPSMRYGATEGPYDLDDPVGTGATPEEAIEDLKWKLEK